MCQIFESGRDAESIYFINTYLSFIKFCQQPNGHFFNYVDEYQQFTSQNTHSNLDDSNGRAIWALGYLISLADKLPFELVEQADLMLNKALAEINRIHSTRAMAFAIKGL